MPNHLKKTSLFFLVISILIAGFFGGLIDKKENYLAQASLWDAIRAWVTINPLEVDVSVPAEAEIDRVFKATVEAINKGEEKIENARGEIFISDGLVLLKKNPVQKIGMIQGKKGKKASWTVKGTKTGKYVISISITGELNGSLISAERSVMIEIKKSIEKPRPRKWYQGFFDFFQKWFNGDRES